MMSTKIDVKVTVNAKKAVVKLEGDIYKVYVTAQAVDGKANKALIRVLADHFNIKLKQISIVKGLKSRIKVINIEN